MFENFIWLKSRSAIFCYVPKVACTNFKCIFRYLEGCSDWLDPQIAHNRKKSGLIFLSEVEERVELLERSDVKRYAVVRDPYSRILSAYKNKIEPYVKESETMNRDQFFYDIYRKVNLYVQEFEPKEKGLNFYGFLRWIEQSGNVHAKNEHWLPQIDIFNPDHIQFDYIGRFETLKKDADYILKALGCDVPFPSQEAVRFPATNASEQVQNYYGERERLLVRRLYADDFRTFGYAK